MATRAKRTRAKPTKRPELRDRIRLHIETTRRLLELIDNCTALRDAGKIDQALKLFRQVEKLNEKLLELENIKRRARKAH